MKHSNDKTPPDVHELSDDALDQAAGGVSMPNITTKCDFRVGGRPLQGSATGQATSGGDPGTGDPYYDDNGHGTH